MISWSRGVRGVCVRACVPVHACSYTIHYLHKHAIQPSISSSITTKNRLYTTAVYVFLSFFTSWNLSYICKTFVTLITRPADLRSDQQRHLLSSAAKCSFIFTLDEPQTHYIYPIPAVFCYKECYLRLKIHFGKHLSFKSASFQAQVTAKTNTFPLDCRELNWQHWTVENNISSCRLKTIKTFVYS